jgi:hypothetical protein
MGFLAPLFLAGLAALAIPIAVHLTNRERKEVVAFPSLMFLQQIPYRSVRRQRLRHILLFAVRCAALILLVAAFARPLVERSGSAAALGTGAREVVILLDRSYSMEYGDRFSRAQDAARDAVSSLGAADQGTLILFDGRATVAFEGSSDVGALRAAIGRATVGSGITRYTPALKIAQGILDDTERPRREVVLISDFQSSGWEEREEVPLPAGTSVVPVDVGESVETVNTAVTDVTLFREAVGVREQLTVSARLVNTGTDSVSMPASLEVNGRVLETRSIRVPPRGAGTVTFAAVPIPDGISRGTVSTPDDLLPADNSFHFVVSPEQALSVLILEPPAAPAAHSLYLSRALAIGDRPVFRTARKQASALNADDLTRRSLVILNDANFPTGDAGRRLREFVTNGGGLLVILGERSNPRTWGAEAQALLPGTVGAPTERPGGRGSTLASIDYGHPVFELFNAPRSGDFSGARFYRYRTVTPADSAAILARYEDGNVALAAHAAGEGRVLLMSSTVDALWNDLAVQPVFLPFVHQLVKYAAAYSEVRPWFNVGQVLDVSAYARELSAIPAGTGSALPATSADARELIAEAPSGETVGAVDSQQPGFIEVAEQGFYELRTGGVGNRGRGLAVAVNLDLSESDLSRMDPAELVAAVTTSTPGTRAAGAGTVQLTTQERERRQSLWWFLLIGAVVLLAAETLLSNRLSRGAVIQ